MSPTPLLFADIHHSGDHEGAWRLPSSPIERINDPGYYLDFARSVQAGGFDGVFFADFVGYDPLVSSVIRWPFEPTTLAAAILHEVPDLNIVITSSTVFTTPEQLYRTFRTLHALSDGRIGWNIVTTGAPKTARAFGNITVPGHDERYQVADGIVDRLRERWGSDRPLLVQAGASDTGRAFAARHADVVFGATPTKDAARAFRTDLRRRAAEAGRDPDEIRFLPGILTTLGATGEEASALRDTLDGLVTEEAARHMLAMYGISMPPGAFDDAVGALVLEPGHNGIRSRAGVLGEIVEKIGPSATWRQLVTTIAGSRGHLSVTGTGADVAAVMNDWLDDEVCDGFIVKFAHSPGGVTDYVASVSPHLNARGIGHRAGWPAAARP